MATKAVLAELANQYEVRSKHIVVIESAGGVDAANRVQAGEPFDVVVLAADAIDKLLAAGHLAGMAEQIRDRIVTPPPGVPVGSLIARALLAFMASPAATDAKRRQGMEAA
jgi:molybdate transport system substrate-binding protein